MHFSMGINERISNLDSVIIFALARLVQKLLAKKSLVLRSCRYFDLLTMTSFLTWPKNDQSKNGRSRPSVSNAVYRLLPVSFLSRSPGGGVSAPRLGTDSNFEMYGFSRITFELR